MKLENEVAVIVPSTNGTSVADPVLIQTQIDKALVDLSLLNGGATAQPGIGCWVDDSGSLVKENVTVISSSCGDITIRTLRTLVTLSKAIKVAMNQEAVSVKINGTLYIR